MSRKVLPVVLNKIQFIYIIRLQLNYYEIYALTQNQHHQVGERSKYD